MEAAAEAVVAVATAAIVRKCSCLVCRQLALLTVMPD